MKITPSSENLFVDIWNRLTGLFSTSTPVTQSVIDKCAAISLKNSADIAVLFARDGGFIKWYNRTLSDKPEFSHRGAISISTAVADHFTSFWDQIPVTFSAPATSAIEFSALMSIGIQENSGDLSSNTEKVGRPGYPGLVYAFEKIPNVKSSYNVNSDLENWTAYKLFKDPSYVDAHKALPAYHQAVDSGVDPAWNTATWPGGFSPKEDEAVNGFIMEADFYKFRGRGVIQTTGRGDYKVMIDYLLRNADALNKPGLIALKNTWDAYPVPTSSVTKGDVIASRSTNAQWESAFAEAVILAAAIAEDSRIKGNYLKLARTENVLNAGKTTPGSLYYMAKKINGGSYPDQVVPMMKAMLRGIANLQLAIS